MSYLKTLKKDGVVLVKDAWPEDEIKKIPGINKTLAEAIYYRFHNE